MSGSIAPAPAVPMCELHPSRFAESCENCAREIDLAFRRAEAQERIQREVKLTELFAAIYSVNMVELAIQRSFWRTCLNCEHFQNDQCNHPAMPTPATPPPKIIMFGCDGHSEEIPF